jgi:hypothetical protein
MKLQKRYDLVKLTVSKVTLRSYNSDEVTPINFKLTEDVIGQGRRLCLPANKSLHARLAVERRPRIRPTGSNGTSPSTSIIRNTHNVYFPQSLGSSPVIILAREYWHRTAREIQKDHISRWHPSDVTQVTRGDAG